jgi:hypothetical protein
MIPNLRQATSAHTQIKKATEVEELTAPIIILSTTLAVTFRIQTLTMPLPELTKPITHPQNLSIPKFKLNSTQQSL